MINYLIRNQKRLGRKLIKIKKIKILIRQKKEDFTKKFMINKRLNNKNLIKHSKKSLPKKNKDFNKKDFNMKAMIMMMIISKYN